MGITKQVRTFNGEKYSFNGWLKTKQAVKRYRKDRGGKMRAVEGKSSTGKTGYLIYVR